MANSKTEKKRLKRKRKKKQIHRAKFTSKHHVNGLCYLEDAGYFLAMGRLDKAERAIKKAFAILPDDEDVLHAMGHIGSQIEDEALELKAIEGLERIGKIQDDMKITRVIFLFNLGRYDTCLEELEKVLKELPSLKLKNKRAIKKDLKNLEKECQANIENKKDIEEYEEILSRIKKDQISAKKKNGPAQKKWPSELQKDASGPSALNQQNKEKGKTTSSETASDIQDVPVISNVDDTLFRNLLGNPHPSSLDTYEVALLSHQIRFAESFESLVCLSSLSQVQSFWYQEETARKVLKQFRGRALLSDEVGLGKTIEALMILVEYIKRGMVKSGIILTPTPLVSQWKEEMRRKFNMDVPSTDDMEFKSGDKKFWDHPFVIASINHAKSKKNFDLVTAREYDMIIVDEAHHLKNRSTLNWKLVNALKKRFILLLTATPVENNLMELYNLITLLKPGQLDTAKAFREKFMTRGDPTDPRNQVLLKELLGQVMIRNTRALAGIHIPPRFAETINIDPLDSDKEFYKRLESLILAMNKDQKGRARVIVKNLLAQAGSSPTAVASSLDNMLARKIYSPELEEEIMAVKNLCRTTVDTPKNKTLMKVINAGKGEKIIVFVKYKATIEHLAEFLDWNNYSFSLFHGGMDNKQKDAAIEAFRTEKQILVTTEIGGEGRNLQFCARMVNYDLPWNPMKIEQRIGRIHRIGQENQVQIYNFCATGSIEDYILDVLDRKINMFEMVIGEIDMILGRIKGEKEFSEMVYDLFVEAESEQDRKKSFANLGQRMKRAKTGYNKTRELDDTLFGDNYEL
ncbi:MAG: SNF2-related protein [Desulfobacteraceae bacterium]